MREKFITIAEVGKEIGIYLRQNVAFTCVSGAMAL